MDSTFAASWRRSPGPMTSWLEAVMLGEKRDEHASYTNAKCDNVNIKLDSPQSESDRGGLLVHILAHVFGKIRFHV